MYQDFFNFANARSNLVTFLQVIHYIKVSNGTAFLNKNKKATKEAALMSILNFKEI